MERVGIEVKCPWCREGCVKNGMTKGGWSQVWRCRSCQRRHIERASISRLSLEAEKIAVNLLRRGISPAAVAAAVGVSVGRLKRVAKERGA